MKARALKLGCCNMDGGLVTTKTSKRAGISGGGWAYSILYIASTII